MQISEAILAAIPLGIPQGRGRYFGRNADREFCACALGQALIGGGFITLELAEELSVASLTEADLGECVAEKIPEAWQRLDVRVPAGLYKTYDASCSARAFIVTLNDGDDCDDCHPESDYVPVRPHTLPEIAAKLAELGA